jgi:hypothetical protein
MAAIKVVTVRITEVDWFDSRLLGCVDRVLDVVGMLTEKLIS